LIFNGASSWYASQFIDEKVNKKTRQKKAFAAGLARTPLSDRPTLSVFYFT